MGASHSSTAEWRKPPTERRPAVANDQPRERQRLVARSHSSHSNSNQNAAVDLGQDADHGQVDGEGDIDNTSFLNSITQNSENLHPQQHHHHRHHHHPSDAPGSPRAVDHFEPSINIVSSDSDSVLHTDMSLALPPTPSASNENLGLGTRRKFRILLLMSDTGGGHRASAQALEAAFNALYPGRITISTVDFWTTVAGWPFHNFPQQYTFLAKRPVLWKIMYLWAAFRPTRALTELAFTIFAHRKTRKYFENAEPDLILSVHPLVNRLSCSVLAYMRRRVDAHMMSYPSTATPISGTIPVSSSTSIPVPPSPTTSAATDATMNVMRPIPPFVTVVTDLGDAHPTWFDHRADMVYVPSQPLRELAIGEGVRPDSIRLLGLPTRPAFWAAAPERQLLRAKLGMAQHIPTVLLVGGGDGVGGLMAIAGAIAVRIAEDAGAAAGQLVVVCGKNKGLLAKMRARSWPVPVILKGFVNNMSDWMSACDIICSKAGPGTIAEAWIRGLPIILTGFLPGQEEGNVRLVTQSGSGEFHTMPDDIAKCAARWVIDSEERAAVSARGLELGRPNSTSEIAKDIWALGAHTLKERDGWRRRVRGRVQAAFAVAAAEAMAQGQVPNGYIAMARYYVGSAIRSVQRGLFGRGGYELARPN